MSAALRTDTDEHAVNQVWRKHCPAHGNMAEPDLNPSPNPNEQRVTPTSVSPDKVRCHLMSRVKHNVSHAPQSVEHLSKPNSNSNLVRQRPRPPSSFLPRVLLPQLLLSYFHFFLVINYDNLPNLDSNVHNTKLSRALTLILP